ncbi:MAG: ATP-binding protein [Syntrophaceae bacterium]
MKQLKVKLREQAEKKLETGRKRTKKGGLSQAELIHELQVYQVELEMQNEELRKTQVRLDEISSKYFDLYQSAPVGYFIFDQNWAILEANITASRMLGTTQQKITGKPLHDFIRPEFQEIFHLYRRKVLKSPLPHTCELKLVNKMYVSVESISVFDGKQGKTARVRSVFTDITEKKNIQADFIQKLEEKVEERTKELQDANKNLKREISERRRAEEELKKSRDELEDRVKERTALLSKVNAFLLLEIKERKRTEKKLRSAQRDLRAMASEIVMADERTRQHFSADLHDSVVQTLGAAKMRSEIIREHIPEKDSRYFRELQDLLSRAITEARLLMMEMSPPVLYELGIVPALEWLADEINLKNDLNVKLIESNGVEQLTYETQVLIFQAVRELLMNVVKHASANNVDISITPNRNKVKISINDDGKGFNGNVSYRANTSGGFGLFSIRERLKHLGGQLVIYSKPGKGTRVSISVPTGLGKQRA